MKKMPYCFAAALALLAIPAAAADDQVPPGWISAPKQEMIGLNVAPATQPVLVPLPDMVVEAVPPGCTVQAVSWKVTTRNNKHYMKVASHGIRHCGLLTAVLRKPETFRLERLGQPVYIATPGCTAFSTPTKGKNVRSGIRYCSA